MSTAARIREGAQAHWYSLSGKPCYGVPYADKKKAGEERPATLADARKLGLLRSVTTYLKALAKPELEAWKTEQACLAVLTSPEIPGEALDARVHRILQVDKEHVQEAKQKADLGKRIHAALQERFAGLPDVFVPWPDDLAPYLEPAYQAFLEKLHPANWSGRFHTERVLVGDGYAGCTDLIAECQEADVLADWKSTGTLPTKSSWLEHEIQLSAYAAAWAKLLPQPKYIATANVYISTAKPGEFAIHMNRPWQETYNKAFCSVVDLVCWMDGYDPRPLQREAIAKGVA